MTRNHKHRRKFIVRSALFALGFAALAGRAAAGDLELSLVMSSDARYVTPDGGKILITYQPSRFWVQVRNTAKQSKQIFTDRVSGAVSGLSFEITDEAGKKSIVKRKDADGQNKLAASRYLDPDEAIVAELALSPEEWENVEIVPPGEVRRLKVRALYRSGGQSLQSQVYEVTIAPGGMPDIMKAPEAPKAAEPPPVTVIN